jgi:rod shape-determining protein MreB
MRTQHNLLLRKYQEKKIQIGAAIEDLETPPEDMSVQGRDLLTGKPKQLKFLIEKLQRH